MTNRRTFLAGSVAVLAAAPAALEQPSGQTVRLGIISTGTPRTATFFEGMIQRLRERGHVEGQNLVIEFRNAEGDLGSLPTLAAELVRLNVDVIVASGAEATL